MRHLSIIQCLLRLTYDKTDEWPPVSISHFQGDARTIPNKSGIGKGSECLMKGLDGVKRDIVRQNFIELYSLIHKCAEYYKQGTVEFHDFSVVIFL